MYLLAVIACAWVNPAFLLVDVATSVRDEEWMVSRVGTCSWRCTWSRPRVRGDRAVRFGRAGRDFGGWCSTFGPLLNLCGLGALSAGLGAGLPPALARLHHHRARGAIHRMVLCGGAGH